MRDQIWNFIGVIVSILALVITIFIYLFQKRKKEISYEVISNNALLTTREKLAGKLKVLYDEHEVENVRFLIIKLCNTGNIGVPSEDYERPIKFILSNNSRILSAEIILQKPTTLKCELSILENEIELKPVLLNAKDYLVLKIILSEGDSNKIKVDARIKDVQEIKNLTFAYSGNFYIVTGSILFFGGIIGLLIRNPNDKPPTEFIDFLIPIALLIGGFFVFVFLSKNIHILKRIMQLLRK